MIDVTHQISAVRRTVGRRTLEAGEARVVTVVADLPRRRRGPVGRLHERRAHPPLVPAGHRRAARRRPLPARGQRGRHRRALRPAATVRRDLGVRRRGQLDRGAALPPTDDGTRFELEHIAHVDDERWAEFGPGAVGIGWDLGLMGLGLHLSSNRRRIDPARRQAWTVSAGGHAVRDRSRARPGAPRRSRTGTTRRPPAPPPPRDRVLHRRHHLTAACPTPCEEAAGTRVVRRSEVRPAGLGRIVLTRGRGRPGRRLLGSDRPPSGSQQSTAHGAPLTVQPAAGTAPSAGGRVVAVLGHQLDHHVGEPRVRPGGRGPGEAHAQLRGLLARLVVEVPHHLDVVGDEPDRRHHHRAAPPPRATRRGGRRCPAPATAPAAGPERDCQTTSYSATPTSAATSRAASATCRE